MRRIPFFLSVQQFLYILHDADMRVAGKHFGRGSAGGDAGKIDAGVLGGLGIDVAVAGIENVFRSGFEPLHGFLDSLGIRLEGADIITADDPVNEIRHMVQIKFFLDAVAGLAGDDSNPGTALAQRSQCFNGMGEEMSAGCHVTVGFFFIDIYELHGFGCIVGVDYALDGIDHRQADRRADIGILTVRIASFSQSDMETFQYGTFRIYEGIIKVKEV